VARRAADRQLDLAGRPLAGIESRLERLRGVSKPQFRLRVGEVRELHDVTNQAVEVIAIVSKKQAQAWLAEHGTPDASGVAGEGEGCPVAFPEAGKRP
jgi:hypothetical protein